MKYLLGLAVCLIVPILFVSFRVVNPSHPTCVIKQYVPNENCTGFGRQDLRSLKSPSDRGEFSSDFGVRELDNHPLSSTLGSNNRLHVLGWVYSPMPECLADKIFSIVKTAKMQLILIHSSMESDYFSLSLNLLLSLSRSHVDMSEVLVVLYDYEPMTEAVLAILKLARIQYISVWEFDLPTALFLEPKLTAPQFFYVRNVIHLKLLKLGYSILHLDSDLVVLQDHPFKSLNPERYLIEAAPGASPKPQRMKWGHTMNCGYMSIVSAPQTIRFVERLLAYNLDSDHPIDQWAFNEVLDNSGVTFETHTNEHGLLVQFKQDRGPVLGYVDMLPDKLHVRILDSHEYIAGRWLNQHNRSKLEFQPFIEAMNLNPKSVHISNVQKGVGFKTESLKLKGLWFLDDDWDALVLSGRMQNLSSLDNGSPQFGKKLK